MTQHFTKNTVSAAFWCSKCEKNTQHRIDNGRKGPCLECIAKLDKLYEQHENFKRGQPQENKSFDWEPSLDWESNT